MLRLHLNKYTVLSVVDQINVKKVSTMERTRMLYLHLASKSVNKLNMWIGGVFILKTIKIPTRGFNFYPIVVLWISNRPKFIKTKISSAYIHIQRKTFLLIENQFFQNNNKKKSGIKKLEFREDFKFIVDVVVVVGIAFCLLACDLASILGHIWTRHSFCHLSHTPDCFVQAHWPQMPFFTNLKLLS